tara:strand:- start:96 stop:650 length:555 start_codon:yes stop_codon:yes gene_type:complete
MEGKNMQNALNNSNLTLEILDEMDNNPQKTAELSIHDLVTLQQLLNSSKEYSKHKSLQLQSILSSKFISHAKAIRDAKNTKGQVSWNSLEDPMISISASADTGVKCDHKSIVSDIVSKKIPGTELIQALARHGVNVKFDVSETNWTKIKASDDPVAKDIRKLMESARTLETKEPSFKLAQKEVK